MRVPVKLFTLLLVAVSAHAQDTAAPTASPGTDVIASYLHSEDQRLVAWGAVFALQTKDTDRLSDLLSLVENWRPIQPYAGAAPQLDQPILERKFAMQLVLDTIIQMQATPPTGSLLNLANDFPMQTAILLSRIAPGEAQQTLRDLYFDSNYGSLVLSLSPLTCLLSTRPLALSPACLPA